MKKDFIIVGEYALKISLIFGILYLIYDVFAVFMPITISIVIALVLSPFVDYLVSKKMPQTLAIVLSIVSVFFVLGFFVVFLVAPLINEVDILLKTLPQMAVTLKNVSIVWLDKITFLDISNNVNALFEKALEAMSNYVLSLLQNIFQSTLSIASNILGFIVLPILVFYFLKDGRRFSSTTVILLPSVWQTKAQIIFVQCSTMISNYVRGIMIVGCIAGFVIGTGTFFIGLDYPIVFALLAVLGEAVPMVGPIFSTIPALLFAAVKGPNTLVLVAVFYFIYYQIEAYVIAPRITGKLLDIHPVFIIISILIGGKLAGAIGMIVAVPSFALIRILMNNIIEQRLHNKE